MDPFSIIIKGKRYFFSGLQIIGRHIKFRWLRLAPSGEAVWSEVIFTPNILCIILCLIGVAAAEISTGESNYYKNFNEWRKQFSNKSLNDILEIFFLKALNLILFLAMYISGGYTIARLVSHWNYLNLNKSLKWLGKSYIYFNNFSRDPALSDEQRKEIKDIFWEDFTKEFEETYGKMFKFTKSILKSRLKFWLLFEALPFVAEFIGTNSYFDIFLWGSEYSFLTPSFILVILSYLLNIYSNKFWNLKQLWSFLIYGLLGNLRPCILYYLSETMAGLLEIPYPISWRKDYNIRDKQPDSIISKELNFKNKESKLLNQDEALPMLEIDKELVTNLESSKFCLVRPKPLKEWNFGILLGKRITHNKRVRLKIRNEIQKTSIEEMFNF